MTAHATVQRPSPPVEPAANDAGACPWTPSDPPRSHVDTGGDACQADRDLCVHRSAFAMATAAGHDGITPRLTCVTPDHRAYDGDLWSDVIEYRTTRRRLLGGTSLTPPEQLRLTALEDRLRALGQQRQFRRFQCRHPARLHTAAACLAVELVDVSAGGAKLIGVPPLVEGDDVELVIESAGVPTVGMPSRVIWVRPGAAGIMFAGAPRWT